MPKYETVVRKDFDADESFKKAYKVIGKFLKKNPRTSNAGGSRSPAGTSGITKIPPPCLPNREKLETGIEAQTTVKRKCSSKFKISD